MSIVYHDIRYTSRWKASPFLRTVGCRFLQIVDYALEDIKNDRILLLDNHGFGSALPWLSVPMFTLVITLYSVFLTWVRIHSGSIWPGVLAHAVINTYVSFMFASFSFDNSYIGSPIGFVTMLPFAAVDLWLITTGRLQAGRSVGDEMPTDRSHASGHGSRLSPS